MLNKGIKMGRRFLEIEEGAPLIQDLSSCRKNTYRRVIWKTGLADTLLRSQVGLLHRQADTKTMSLEMKYLYSVVAL